MITEEKVRIYTAYFGDVDAWGRARGAKEKAIMNDNDWYLIQSLLQDLVIVNKGLASESYVRDVESKLLTQCDNERTIDLLRELSKRK